MQYLLMIYEAEEIWESKTDEEKSAVLAIHRQLNERLDTDGVAHSGEPLQPTSTAVCVRRRGGDTEISDGPFAETKEQLAGFYLVDVDSIDQALEYAAMIPTADYGTVEVRPVANYTAL